MSNGLSEHALVIRAAVTTLDSNTTDRLSAAGSGMSAHPAIQWSVVDGQNNPALGQGSIAADGTYTPPALLSRDAINVEVKASQADDPAAAATYILTVTPGFVQSLTPENADLSANGTLTITSEIAEVGAGSVQWSLASSASGQNPLSSAYGAIHAGACRHSSQSYTLCTATYTAPASLPANSPSLYVIARASGNAGSAASTHILLNRAGFNTSPLENEAAQTGYVAMGSSGGNANDYDSSRNSQGEEYVNDCCGGTLGALVQDQNDDLYILSNDHVLAESDQARAGDTIVQPALIDLNCNPQAGRQVGALRYTVPLANPHTNVDAALAVATPAVDSSGAILGLGAPSNGRLSPGAPAGGTGEALTANILDRLRVAKSGRTTGLTCSTVNAVDLSVQVDYFYDCAETEPSFTKTYTNQIGISGAGFADSGDSGSLVVDADNAEPVGLLFSSGGDSDGNGFSVANPIGDVLSELGKMSNADGLQFQVAGGAPHPVTCSNYDRQVRSAPGELSPAQAEQATAAADVAASTLVRADNGILGLATGRSLDAPNEPAVIVFTDKAKGNVPVPKLVDGLRTVVIPTDADNLSTAAEAVDLPQGIHLPADVLRAAEQVQQQYAARFMADPAFFGVGVSQSYDNPAEAALIVLVDMKKTPRSMPDIAGGLRVRYVRINRLHVTRSKFVQSVRPTSCQLRAARAR